MRPSKALGQNFVVDPNTPRRIVRLAGVESGDSILEVGAGFGTLTLALAEVARKVIAIEFDRALVEALREVTTPHSNIEIVHGDAMDLDYETLLGESRFRFVSNLPYSLAVPLIAKLLVEARQIETFVVMVQKEVGERLVARPGSGDYGSVSVLVAYHCLARLLGRVPTSVFWPVPKVESVLVELVRRPPPVDVPADRLMSVVRASFAQRRKKVRNSLSATLGLPTEKVESALAAASVDQGARAESLGLEDFARIAQAIG